MIDDSDLTEAQLRARKVKPQYGEGQLVKVAYARNQAEAELIAGLLLEEGVPSVIRRNAGFDVPDFLAAGPRDILVAASGVDVAQDVLRDTRGSDPVVPGGADPLVPRLRTERRSWVRVLAITVVLVLGISSIAGAVAALLG